MFAAIGLVFAYPGQAFILLLALGVIGLVAKNSLQKEKQDKEDKKASAKRAVNRNLSEELELFKKEGISQGSLLFRVSDKTLYMFNWDEFEKHYEKIDFTTLNKDATQEILEEQYQYDSIKYYQMQGSVENQQIITGGGGGGSSVQGAVVGAALAGEAGAVIGSRKATNEVVTSYETVDNRHTEITFTNNTRKVIPGDFLYDLLLNAWPEKEYSNYVTRLKNQALLK